ncbi:MAG: HAD-IC family P-type ATPase [Thiotrichaceae bacterium]
MLDLGIVLMAYAGIRMYENHLAKRAQKSVVTVEPKALEDQTVAEIAADDSEKQQDLHYMKVSAVAIGLGVLRNFYPPVALLSLGVFTYAAIPYLRQLEKSLLVDEKIDGYVLYGVADLMTLGLNRYATAAVGVGLVHTAKYVISNAQDKSKKMMIDVFAKQPQYVWIIHDGVEIEIPLEKLRENHIVVVTTGEVIPADGVIIQGIATVDQHALTGESQPAEKEVGDRVFASTVLMAGRIHIKVDKSGRETTVAKIVEILNKSINYKTNTQLRGEQWADSWNIPVLGLAFMSMPILGPVGTVVILNGHIAQTIRIAAPLGTLNHLNIAAYKGILVKDGCALESLGKIDTLLFDKTGTLTDEQPTVGQIIVCDQNYTEMEILAYAAAAECKLAHPIAKAIIQKAQDSHVTLPNIAESKYQIGYGITVRVADKVVRVGSIRFMELEKIRPTARSKSKSNKCRNKVTH